MNFLFGIVAIAIGATVRALPVVEEMRAGGSRDRIRSGAEILLALQQVESAVGDGDVVSHGSIADGLRAMPCTSIMQAAQEPVGSGAPMRLVFPALEAANSDLSKLTCVRAFSQVTQAPPQPRKPCNTPHGLAVILAAIADCTSWVHQLQRVATCDGL
jgi:hypothetical protein